MTYRQAYQFTLLELECVRHRAICSHNCMDCSYFVSSKQIEDALKLDIELIRSKDPILYLSNDIDLLKEVINNGDKS